MCKNSRRIIVSIAVIIVGIVLIVVSKTGMLDYNLLLGFGSGLIAAGIVILIKNLRYRNNEEYKKEIDISENDERNRILRMKAWSIAGYVYIMAAAAAFLVFTIKGMNEIAEIMSFSICFIIIVYLISYFYLQRKN